MNQRLAATDADIALLRRAMRPIIEEKALDTGPCLAADAAWSVFTFARKVKGAWFEIEGKSDANPAERLDVRFQLYLRLAPFVPIAAAALLGGCAALDALGICPVHCWFG